MARDTTLRCAKFARKLVFENTISLRNGAGVDPAHWTVIGRGDRPPVYHYQSTRRLSVTHCLLNPYKSVVVTRHQSTLHNANKL